LRADSGEVVLINRGFVPLDWRDPAARPPSPEGVHAVVGVVRLSGADRALTVDLQTLDGAAPQGFPEPVPPRVDLPDNHLQYALTWWALAAALATIYMIWRRNAGRDAA
ncbi:MAG TPA: SURF1 family cytochrome oxidase biogenesis protein, partial [Azospirillaceae bacterium]|nr:SURF1 family cytochrome oxidase biogenesis protein [Azospirillaceae bacterium]